MRRRKERQRIEYSRLCDCRTDGEAEGSHGLFTDYQKEANCLSEGLGNW